VFQWWLTVDVKSGLDRRRGGELFKKVSLARDA
jgi:hypothetical protein